MPAATREWDARAYDRLTLPHARWGAALLDRLPLAGDEHVLDAGCGTGRDTLRLLERLPAGRVTAVDGFRAMLDRLRERLPPAERRVRLVHADLRRLPELDAPVDVVVSVATLHWVPEADQEVVLAGFAAALRPGGLLAFECGGAGNIASVVEAIRRVTGEDGAGVGWSFQTPAAVAARLAGAGFHEVSARLVADPAQLPDRESLAAYLRTVVLGAHLDRLPPDDHGAFVAAVVDAMPAP
ncbi:MAG TPA: class I SAM-dependent methyltransferase, partial [Frankiaceae bacterium]|nr:class I SAM-dependent methyltransferase [Frankiaceae bacterium]